MDTFHHGHRNVKNGARLTLRTGVTGSKSAADERCCEWGSREK
jgi:hypothetical protein